MSGVRAGASNLGKSAFFVLDDAERVAAGAVAAFSVHAGQGCAIGSAKQPNGCESAPRSSASRPDAAAHSPSRLVPDRYPTGGAGAPISKGCPTQAGRVVLRWLASQSRREGPRWREGTATVGPLPGPAVRHRGAEPDAVAAGVRGTAARRTGAGVQRVRRRRARTALHRVGQHVVRHAAVRGRSCWAWALGVRGGR